MPRKNELSFMNIVFCMLVIFIHISSAPISGLSKDSWQYGVFFVPWRLSAFVVQGFIFLSGLKMFLKPDNEPYKMYFLSRFNKVVVPYIFAVFIFYIYFLDRHYFAYNTQDLLGYIIKGDLVAHFYFVIAIVQFYLLKPLWKLVVDKVSYKIAIPVSVVLMFLLKYSFSDFAYNDRLFTTYLVYWIIGCYVGKYYNTFLENVKKRKNIITSVFFVVAVVESTLSYIQFTGGGIRFLEEVHFVYCICAVFFVLSIALKLGDRVMRSKLLRKIDITSYYIYLIHPLIIFLVNENLAKFGVIDMGTGFVIRGMVTYVVSIAVAVGYSEVKKKIKRKILCRNSEK